MQLHAFSKRARIRLAAVRKTLLLMKLVAVMLLAFCLRASAKTYSQEITLSLSNVNLEKVFKEIQKQTHYRFVYTKEALEISKKVSLEVKKASLESVLQLCFHDQPITYTIEDRFVIISLKGKPGEKKIISQLRDIIGQIINEQGEPVAGATVIVKGTNKGAFSNEKGQFIIRDVEPNAILIVSSVGYQIQEISLQGRASILVQLMIAVNILDETVVIAYGITTKRFNTGNVNTVKAEDIQKQPVSNPLA